MAELLDLPSMCAKLEPNPQYRRAKLAKLPGHQISTQSKEI